MIVVESVDTETHVIAPTRSGNQSDGVLVPRSQGLYLDQALDAVEARWADQYPAGVDEMVQRLMFRP